MCVLPAILASDAEALRERLVFPQFWTPDMTAHVDILDGSMFDAECFFDPAAVAADGRWEMEDGRLQTKTSSFFHFPASIELHCMVRNPMPIIAQWKTLVPQTKRAIIHAEIGRPLNPILEDIRMLSLEAGVALCPDTPIAVLDALTITPDRVLIMGIEPGASGRTFLGEPILAKLRRLSVQSPDIHLSVDGGVTHENAPSLLAAGASSLVAASAIWETRNPRQSYEQLIHTLRSSRKYEHLLYCF